MSQQTRIRPISKESVFYPKKGAVLAHMTFVNESYPTQFGNVGHRFGVHWSSRTEDTIFTRRETHQRNLTKTLGYIAKIITPLLAIGIEIPPVRTFIYVLGTVG